MNIAETYNNNLDELAGIIERIAVLDSELETRMIERRRLELARAYAEGISDAYQAILNVANTAMAQELTNE